MAGTVGAVQSLAAGFTQQQLYDFLKAQLLAVGFTLHEEYTVSTTKHMVFSLVLDAAKAKGTVYYRVGVTSAMAVDWQLYDTWNTGTHTGTNASSAGSASFSTASAYQSVTAFRAGEAWLVWAGNTTNTSHRWLLGMLRPAYKPSYWDEDTWPYALHATSGAVSTWSLSALSPFSSTSVALVALATSAVGANPYTNKREVLPGLVFYLAASPALLGRTSDDFAQVPNQTVGDTIQVTAGSEEWGFFALGTHNTAAGLAVRTI